MNTKTDQKVVIKLVLDAQFRAELKAQAALEMRSLNASILYHLRKQMPKSVPVAAPQWPQLDPKQKAEIDAFYSAEEGNEHP